MFKLGQKVRYDTSKSAWGSPHNKDEILTVTVLRLRESSYPAWEEYYAFEKGLDLQASVVKLPCGDTWAVNEDALFPLEITTEEELSELIESQF